MSDFVVDGSPLETPIGEAEKGYAMTPPSLDEAFKPWSGSESNLERTGSSLKLQNYYPSQRHDFDSIPGQNDVPAAIPTPMLSAEEANKRYAPPGTTITDKDIPEGAARLIGETKKREIERENIIGRYTAAHGLATNFAVGMAAFLTDPLNIGTLFLPGIGEETALAQLGRIGIGSKVAARAVAGGATGAIAQAPLSALKYGIGQQFASDYDMRSGLRDVMFAGAAGAVLHAGFGAAGDAIRSRVSIAGKFADSVATGEMAEQAAPILNADAATRADAMRMAVSQLATGREVDVGAAFPEAGEFGLHENAVTGGHPLYERIPSEPMRLSSFLKSRGGLKDEGGDLFSSLGGYRTRPGLINKNGLSLDEAARLAWEEGYFPEHGNERPDVNTLLKALDEDARGNKHYSAQDENAVSVYKQSIAHNSEVDQLAAKLGINQTGLTRGQFFDKVAEHLSAEQQAEEHTALVKSHEEAFLEAEERAKAFLESRGDSWEPDAFYHEGKGRSLEDLEREYKQANSSPAVREGDGGGAEPGSSARDQEQLQAGGRQGSGGTEPGRFNEGTTAATGSPTDNPRNGGQYRPEEYTAPPGPRGTVTPEVIGQIAQREQQLYRDGFSSGMTQGELEQVTDDVYGEHEASPAQPKLTAPRAAESSGEKQLSPEEAHMAMLEQSLADFQASGGRLTQEERALLDATDRAMKEADLTESALQQAANCLMESGL